MSIKVKLNLPFVMLTTLFLVACPLISQAKAISEEEKTFSEVIEVPGNTKEHIYIGTKSWIAETFNSAKAVIETDSKEDGLVIGNGSISYPCKGLECMAKPNWRVPFTIKVEMKEEKLRVTFSNIRIALPASSAGQASEGPLRSESDLNKIKPALLDLAAKLGESIKSKKTSADW